MIKYFMIMIMFFTSSLYSTQIAAPYLYISASENGKYYFKMIPGKIENNYKDSYGILYKVTPNENDIVLWKVYGWYAYRTFVSYDGKCLVRMNVDNLTGKPSKKDLAIAFYKSGKLVKSYSTVDLITDYSKIVNSWGFFIYLEKVIGFEGPNMHGFKIITLDKHEIYFDAETGKIISRKKLGYKK